MSSPSRILVLCVGNSCRSQIAEGWFRRLGKGLEVSSAGSRPAAAVHPLAVRVMGEAGVDISRAVPKPIERFLGAAFDYVITVCGEAEEACPVFMGRGERLHWPVADPAVAEGDEATRLEVYRAARDEIRDRVQGFLEQAGLLASNEAGPVTG